MYDLVFLPCHEERKGAGGINIAKDKISIPNGIEVEVHFKGETGSGKTILLREIKNFLLDYGLQVTSDENKHMLYVRN
jgi:ABC-type uncharacterized transport system fused permease/ATPase subunit